MGEQVIEFQLVDNKSYEVSGVYYGGQHPKYHDVFKTTTKEHGERFACVEDAQKVTENLNHGGYVFEVVPA